MNGDLSARRALLLCICMMAGCLPYVDFTPRCDASGGCLGADVVNDVAPDVTQTVDAIAPFDTVGADIPAIGMDGPTSDAVGQEDVADAVVSPDAAAGIDAVAPADVITAIDGLDALDVTAFVDMTTLPDGAAFYDADTATDARPETAACASGEVVCGGACVVTDRDANHCGGCGHACARGACVAGSCASEQRSCLAAGTPGCGLVSVAGGAFVIGNDSLCAAGSVMAGCAIYSAPSVSDVRVSAFDIDAYEVTVARFRAFWSARAAELDRIRSRPISYPGGSIVPWGEAASAPVSTAVFPSCNWSEIPAGREGHPINCVGWSLAQEFCVWDGGRLPTEAEWEFAARGRALPASGLVAGRAYPWGDQTPVAGVELSSCDRALFAPCPGEDGAPTRRVGRFAATAGLYDLAGNLAEWLADAYVVAVHRRGCWPSHTDPLCAGGADLRLIAGGAWVNGEVNVRSASRVSFPSASPLNSVGFRCVRSP